MGAGSIIENSVKDTTSLVWDKVPTLADKSWLNFDLKDTNKSFVNLAVAVGVIVLAKSAIKMTTSTLKCLSSCKKIPTATELQDKYGHRTWALIADCRGNEEYAAFLAKSGFNLVLMGDEQDIRIAKDISEGLNYSVQIECFPVDWKQQESNLQFFEKLMEEIQNLDVSIVVLPKMLKPKEQVPSHLEIVQPFAHVYLLVRYFCQKLTWRSYKSALIFPSFGKNEEISQSNGISKSIIAGLDAFGRIIQHEQKANFETVVARGSVENAFIGLGKQEITY